MTALNARELALVVMAWGWQGHGMTPSINRGIVLAKKTGDYVETGEVLATLQNAVPLIKTRSTESSAHSRSAIVPGRSL